MIKELNYPFDSVNILKNKRRLKKQLLAESGGFLRKKIAILGGSTVAEIADMLELFLLNAGIVPEFYISAYGRYFEEAVFETEKIAEFAPDVIFIHTSFINIKETPGTGDSKEEIEAKLNREFGRFNTMWSKLLALGCPVIQNNFERPPYRLMGNSDITDPRGKTSFVRRLNGLFYDMAEKTPGFYIHDIDYLAGEFGRPKWSDPMYMQMYKYVLCIEAIPEFAADLANIIKSIFGRNKKVLAVDLDNTLWGGVIGDDGLSGIKLGREIAAGEAYSDFQQYVRSQKDIGVLLTVCSKNEMENALEGFTHPGSQLTAGDFANIKANWDNKALNLSKTASELNLGVDSIVFVDDNPVERELVSRELPGVAVPEIADISHFAQVIDRNGYFEVTSLSADDIKRSRMYAENAKREAEASNFADYDLYLLSLEQKAEILPLDQVSLARVTQLVNKTNQFNLTTRRYTESEISAIAGDKNYIALYGRLADRFGDNGIVSVLLGRQEGDSLDIELFVMSCRVFKRNLENAMLDELIRLCGKRGITKLIGTYIPSAKNAFCSDYYASSDFRQTGEEDGATFWALDIQGYKNKNTVIEVTNGQE